jgi:hypothetical protein
MSDDWRAAMFRFLAAVMGRRSTSGREKRRAEPARGESLTHLLDSVEAMAANHDVGDAHAVRVGDIMLAVGRRAYAPVLLLLGLLSLSPAALLPGMNWLAAAMMLLLTIQMTIGARHPWLPHNLLDARLPRASVRDASKFARPWAARLDRLVRPRLCFLTEAPFVNLAGFLCTVAALSIFPLGLVPLGPFAPSLAITAVALGLFFRNGPLLLGGAGIVLGAATFAYRLLA